MKLLNTLATAAVLALTAASAHAAVITSPEASYIPFAELEAFTTGPVTVAPGITWTSTNADYQGGSVYGYTGGYGFGSNGYDTEDLVGLNDSSDAYGVVDSMTFSFATPVSTIGAFLNWVPNESPVTIAAYDSGGDLLDSLVLSEADVNVVTPNAFYGFAESTADISSFVLTDGYIAALSGLNGKVITGSAPEPSAWALMMLGIGAIGYAFRAKKTQRFTFA